jgi:hypothetical protein
MSAATDELTIADIARQIQGEYTRVTEAFMATVDLFESAQAEGQRVNFKVFRKASGKTFRLSAAMHASALADLMDTIGTSELDDADREYVQQLEDYAAEIKPKNEEGEG